MVQNRLFKKGRICTSDKNRYFELRNNVFLSHSKINFKPIKPIQLQGLFSFPVLFLALYQKYKTQIVLTHKYLSLTKRFSICVYYSYSSCPCIYDIWVLFVVVVVMTDHS